MKRGIKKYDALRVPCPKCGVYEWKPCVRKNNVERKAFHVERHVKARNYEAPSKPKKGRAKGYGSEWAMIRAKVFAAKGSLCVYCGKDAAHVDHVMPKARGGSDDLSNLVPCCTRCNHAKGIMTAEEWRG